MRPHLLNSSKTSHDTAQPERLLKPTGRAP
jgi:hypothetical protein